MFAELRLKHNSHVSFCTSWNSSCQECTDLDWKPPATLLYIPPALQTRKSTQARRGAIGGAQRLRTQPQNSSLLPVLSTFAQGWTLKTSLQPGAGSLRQRPCSSRHPRPGAAVRATVLNPAQLTHFPGYLNSNSELTNTIDFVCSFFFWRLLCFDKKPLLLLSTVREMSLFQETVFTSSCNLRAVMASDFWPVGVWRRYRRVKVFVFHQKVLEEYLANFLVTEQGRKPNQSTVVHLFPKIWVNVMFVQFKGKLRPAAKPLTLSIHDLICYITWCHLIRQLRQKARLHK